MHIAKANGGYIKRAVQVYKKARSNGVKRIHEAAYIATKSEKAPSPAFERYVREEEGIHVSMRGVVKFIKIVYERGKQIKHLFNKGIIAGKEGCGRKTTSYK